MQPRMRVNSELHLVNKPSRISPHEFLQSWLIYTVYIYYWRIIRGGEGGGGGLLEGVGSFERGGLMENLRYKRQAYAFWPFKDRREGRNNFFSLLFSFFFFFSSRALPDRLISFNTKNVETSYFEGKPTTVTKHSDVIVLYDWLNTPEAFSSVYMYWGHRRKWH